MRATKAGLGGTRTRHHNKNKRIHTTFGNITTMELSRALAKYHGTDKKSSKKQHSGGMDRQGEKPSTKKKSSSSGHRLRREEQEDNAIVAPSQPRCNDAGQITRHYSVDTARGRRTTFPGAVAVAGPNASSFNNDDEYTFTAPPEEDIEPINTVPISTEMIPVRVMAGGTVYDGEIMDEGEIMLSESKRCVSRMFSSRRKWIALCTAIWVIVGIVLGVVLGVVPNSASTTEPPTLPSASTPPQSLIELLSSVSFDGGEALKTPSTPQNKALNWLARNTNLTLLSDGRKIRRYVLATFFFSTSGRTWHLNAQTGWLSDQHECDWTQQGEENCSRKGNNSIVELQLPWSNLRGSIPNELALLSNSFGA